MSQTLSRLRTQLPAGERLYQVYIVGIVCAGLVGYALFASVRIVPAVRSWHALTDELQSARRAITQVQGAQVQSPEILQQQVAAAQARLKEAAGIFLGEGEAAAVVGWLQACATDCGITLSGLQSQPGPRGLGSGVCEVRSFHIQATGPLVGLEDFVSRVGAMCGRGLSIGNLSIAEGKRGHTLAMDVTVYASPYAEGRLPPAGDANQPRPASSPSVDPGDLSALDAAWAGEDWPRAIALIEQLLAATPQAAEMWDKLYAAYVNYGYHLLQAGNPTEAIAQLNRALEVRPDGPEALTYLQQAARELAAASGAEPLLYVVAAGDTLSVIAERYGTTVEALMAANALETTDIYAGQELIIPAG